MTEVGFIILGVLSLRGILGFVQDYKHFKKRGDFSCKFLIVYWKQLVK